MVVAEGRESLLPALGLLLWHPGPAPAPAPGTLPVPQGCLSLIKFSIKLSSSLTETKTIPLHATVHYFALLICSRGSLLPLNFITMLLNFISMLFRKVSCKNWALTL